MSERNEGWIPVKDRLPEEPKGEPFYYLHEEDVAADEYIVMIRDAVLPTALFWTGREWFEPYIEDVYDDVIAWRPFPEPYIEEG